MDPNQNQPNQDPGSQYYSPTPTSTSSSPLGAQTPVNAPIPAVQPETDTYGLVSIILAFVGFSVVGLIVGLIGASKAKKEGRPPTLSRVGWILNLAFTIIFAGLILMVFMAVPALQRNARVTQDANTKAAITGSLESYRRQHGYYPASLDELGNGVYKYDTNGKQFEYVPTPDGCIQCEAYTLKQDF